tara:strand:+ start:967 stop:5031 length:4065 start_codon:yes stop_codon:yes gene_type:complete
MEKSNNQKLRQRLAELEEALEQELQQKIESLQNKINKTRSTKSVKRTRIAMGEGNKAAVGALYKPSKNISTLTDLDFYESIHFSDGTGRRIAYIHNEDNAESDEISFLIKTNRGGEKIWIEGYNNNEKQVVNVSSSVNGRADDGELKSRYDETTGINTEGYKHITLEYDLNVISCVKGSSSSPLTKLKIYFKTQKGENHENLFHVVPDSIVQHIEVLDINNQNAKNTFNDVHILGRQKSLSVLTHSEFKYYTFTTGKGVNQIGIETKAYGGDDRMSDTLIELYDKIDKVEGLVLKTENLIANNDNGSGNNGKFSNILQNVKPNTQYWLGVRVKWNSMTQENQLERFKMRVWVSEKTDTPGDYDYNVKPVNYGKKVAYETLKYLNGPNSSNRWVHKEKWSEKEIDDAVRNLNTVDDVYEKVQTELGDYDGIKFCEASELVEGINVARAALSHTIEGTDKLSDKTTQEIETAFNKATTISELITKMKELITYKPPACPPLTIKYNSSTRPKVNLGKQLMPGTTYNLPIIEGMLLKFTGGQQVAGNWNDGEPIYTVLDGLDSMVDKNHLVGMVDLNNAQHRGVLFNFSQKSGTISNIRHRYSEGKTAYSNPTPAQIKTAVKQLTISANNDAWGLKNVSYEYVSIAVREEEKRKKEAEEARKKKEKEAEEARKQKEKDEANAAAAAVVAQGMDDDDGEMGFTINVAGTNRLDNTRTVDGVVAQTKVYLGQNAPNTLISDMGNLHYYKTLSNLSKLTKQDFYEEGTINISGVEEKARFARVENKGSETTKEISFRIDTTSAGENIYVYGYNAYGNKETIDINCAVVTNDDGALKSRYNQTGKSTTNTIQLKQGINIVSARAGNETLRYIKVGFKTTQGTFYQAMEVMPDSIKPHSEDIQDWYNNYDFDVVMAGRQYHDTKKFKKNIDGTIKKNSDGTNERVINLNSLPNWYTFITGPTTKKITIETKAEPVGGGSGGSDVSLTLWASNSAISDVKRKQFSSNTVANGGTIKVPDHVIKATVLATNVGFGTLSNVNVKSNTQYWIMVNVKWGAANTGSWAKRTQTDNNQYERFRMCVKDAGNTCSTGGIGGSGLTKFYLKNAAKISNGDKIPVIPGLKIKFIGGDQAAGGWDGKKTYNAIYHDINENKTKQTIAMMDTTEDSGGLIGTRRSVFFDFDQTTGKITNLQGRFLEYADTILDINDSDYKAGRTYEKQFNIKTAKENLVKQNTTMGTDAPKTAVVTGSNAAWGLENVKYTYVAGHSQITSDTNYNNATKQLTVHFKGGQNKKDWIGIYNISATLGTNGSLLWKYLDNTTSANNLVENGTLTFNMTGKPSGSYKIHFLRNNSTTNSQDYKIFIIP